MTTDRASTSADADASGGCTTGGGVGRQKARAKKPDITDFTVGEIITPTIRHYLDDPPYSARGKEGAYYQHLAWYFWSLKPWVTEQECRRTQFVADLLWDLEHDRASVIRRLPAFVIPSHPHLVPPPPRPLTKKQQHQCFLEVAAAMKELAALQRAERRRQADKPPSADQPGTTTAGEVEPRGSIPPSTSRDVQANPTHHETRN